MDRREIQRIAAADVSPDLFRNLAGHGEDLLVERKSQIPAKEKLGAEVASMANMLGGWVLLGVDDKTRKLEELKLTEGTDLQSHIGHLLREAVDPVPPFLADTLEIDGLRVGFIKVFQAPVLVLVKGTGAIYSRDDGGKTPVSDHRLLLDLARAGRDAEEEARKRPDRNAVTQEVLGLPSEEFAIPEYSMKTVVRAAPLSVTPQMAEWPITRGGAVCRDVVEWLAREVEAPQGFDSGVRPFGRAASAWAAPLSPPPIPIYTSVAVADCAGIFGVGVWRGIPNVIETHELRRRHIRPAIEAVYGLLDSAEALGDSVLDLHLIHGRDEMNLMGPDGRYNHRLPTRVHCGSAILSLPADEEDRAELAKLWEREVARTTGIAAWEGGPS